MENPFNNRFDIRLHGRASGLCRRQLKTQRTFNMFTPEIITGLVSLGSGVRWPYGQQPKDAIGQHRRDCQF